MFKPNEKQSFGNENNTRKKVARLEESCGISRQAVWCYARPTVSCISLRDHRLQLRLIYAAPLSFRPNPHRTRRVTCDATWFASIGVGTYFCMWFRSRWHLVYIGENEVSSCQTQGMQSMECKKHKSWKEMEEKSGHNSANVSVVFWSRMSTPSKADVVGASHESTL